MESSRIFVRGLPPNFNLDDFKQHFSKQSSITDAKLIPRRRIGYVGFKTPEDAARAVKYHNKSFIRMSKIGVELARSVEDRYALGSALNSSNKSRKESADAQEHGPTDSRGDEKRKRKREGPADSKGNSKLQEFLEVMRPPSKSNIWENQGARVPQEPAQPTPVAENGVTLVTGSGEVHKPRIKRTKRENESEERDAVHAERPVPVDAMMVPSDGYISQENKQEPLAQATAVSDADWLRSRTSRLLGLMDDHDVQIMAPPEDAPAEKSDLSDVPELVKDHKVFDASIQTDEDVDVERAILENETVDNGRLFVRNLTYTITEEDLRKHFEDRGYGAIEEVRPSLYVHNICLTEFL